MTHSDTLKAQFTYNRLQVLWLTDMTEEEYSNFQIDTAKAWADRYWSDAYDVDKLLASSNFWNWWTYSWQTADDLYFIKLLYAKEPLQRYSSYRKLHQYVFNHASTHQQLLLKDFRTVKESIQQEIILKKEVKNED